jgi:hypothetical protein
MEALKGLPYKKKGSGASYYQLPLPLFITFCDVNHQCQAMSELFVERLWYGEQPIAIAKQLNLCNIFI